jgi:hypothetical protein
MTPAQKSVRLAKLKCLRVARIEQGYYVDHWRIIHIDAAIKRLENKPRTKKNRPPFPPSQSDPASQAGYGQFGPM